MVPRRCRQGTSPGINTTFAKDALRHPAVSLCPGYVTYSLLTRSPLYAILLQRTVRLACLSHAASVRSEPGSNSSILFVRSPAGPCRPTDLTTDRLKRSSANENVRARWSVVHGPPNTPNANPDGTSPPLAGSFWIKAVRTLQGAVGPTFSRRSLFTCQRTARQTPQRSAGLPTGAFFPHEASPLGYRLLRPCQPQTCLRGNDSVSRMSDDLTVASSPRHPQT